MPVPRDWRLLLAVGALLCAPPALAQDGGAPPSVLKGSAIAPAAAPSPSSRGLYRVTAGEDLWLVDAEAGELVACRLLNTSTVGKRVIRCYRRNLPNGF